MKYAVTFCCMDESLDSGKMWHSCILFSKLDEDLNKFEVVNTWGFYGMPATDAPGSFTRRFKGLFRLDVDFNGSHGKWRHEETRYLDQGFGLHGLTFELIEQEFDTLVDYLQNKAEVEDAAICEAAVSLGTPVKTKPRIHRYEMGHPAIFALEQQKANTEGRPSRLQPFKIVPELSFDWWPIHFRNSSTCKSNAVEALKEVLTDDKIAGLIDQGKHPSIPRYSGPLETIILHSRGTLSTHKKRSGDIVHFRDYLDTDKIRVFWSVPPQMVDFIEADPQFKLDERYCEEVKNLVSKLQRLEWTLRNVQVDEHLMPFKQQLIDRVSALYEPFAIVGNRATVSQSFFRPTPLAHDIKTIKQFLSSVYNNTKLELENSATIETNPTLVVCLFPKNAKQSIAKLVGTSYATPIQVQEEEANEDLLLDMV